MTTATTKKRRRKRKPAPTPEQQERINYGAQVRERREAAGLSMADLATKVGVVYTQMSNIELGNCSPSYAVHAKIYDVLKVGAPTL